MIVLLQWKKMQFLCAEYNKKGSEFSLPFFFVIFYRTK